MKYGWVEDTQGILGGAVHLYGNDYISIPGLLGKPSTITLSAWAKLDTADIIGSEILSVGDAVVIRIDDGWRNKGCHGAYFSSPGAPDTATHQYLGSSRFLAVTGWHYFSYVYDASSSKHYFFIDGELYSRDSAISMIHYEGIGTDTKIGAHGNGKPYHDFNGYINEVTVSHKARSPAWIKLSYMNQRIGNKLISVESR